MPAYTGNFRVQPAHRTSYIHRPKMNQNALSSPYCHACSRESPPALSYTYPYLVLKWSSTLITFVIVRNFITCEGVLFLRTLSIEMQLSFGAAGRWSLFTGGLSSKVVVLVSCISQWVFVWYLTLPWLLQETCPICSAQRRSPGGFLSPRK